VSPTGHGISLARFGSGFRDKLALVHEPDRRRESVLTPEATSGASKSSDTQAACISEHRARRLYLQGQYTSAREAAKTVGEVGEIKRNRGTLLEVELFIARESMCM